jgi:internalin A
LPQASILEESLIRGARFTERRCPYETLGSDIMSVGVKEAIRRIEYAMDTDGTSLDLANLHLTELPPSLADLPRLTHLQLDNNQLTYLPDWLANFTNLVQLELENNRLTTLPEWLGDLSNLTTLWLDNNRLTELPEHLGNLANLTTLSIGSSRISVLPGWFRNFTKLTRLDLENNRLTGLPEWLKNFTNLAELRLHDNRLTTLPEWLGDLSNLTTLWLDNNRLTELPEHLGNLATLTTLSIAGCSLTELPEWFRNFTKLTRLDLQNNRLTALPEWLKNFTNLTELRLHNNTRLSVLPDWLRNFTNLTILSIGSCGLTELPDWLGNLTKLTNLQVNNNQLTELPDWLGNLTNLTNLSFGTNQLTELPDWLGNLTNLTNLSFGNNQLTELPDWLGNLTNLTILSIGSCGLTELPDWLGNLTELTNLQVNNNQLTELPDWLGNLTELTSLWLDNNQITSVPDQLRNLTKLTMLGLDNNQLTELPEWLGNLTNLRSLWFENNQLTELPEWLGNLTELNIIRLSNNQLTDLPDWLGNLTELTSLWLDNNRIGSLSDQMGNLTELTSLWLDNNQLTTLPDWLGNLTNLTMLNLSKNQLSSLPDQMGNLTELTSLWLDNNQLTTLPDWLENLTNLTRFTLHNNQLTTLPGWLPKLSEIDPITVSGNPLVSPPPEITAGGLKSIFAFIEARNQGSAQQWVSKLLIVGEGGVGKTSLLRALLDDAHDPEEPSTHGLIIKDLSIEHPDKPSLQMRLSAWDFGGQQIYHATHQFFLTNRSLFLLIWNSRLGWEQGKLRYWLDIIKARAPESPVILVATHINDRPVDLPVNELRQEYPQIASSVSLDNESRVGLEALRAQMSTEAATLPLMGSEWPTTWLTAAESLRNRSEKCITPAQMWETMRSAGVGDRVQQRYIAAALSQLGDILYYHDDPELSETIVLQPEWINEYISKVLDSPHVASSHGLLKRSHLNEIWSDLNPTMRDYFLTMMDKYDLSYRISGGHGDDLSLVVERLQWDPPAYEEAWQEIGRRPDTHEVRVIYELNTTPPGIPTWFIARSHRFSKNMHWRSGALLGHSDGRHLALIRADRHHSTIELSVRGPLPVGFFSILDDGLNLILERFPGLDITRRVPCTCQNPSGESCPGLFNYEDLQARLIRTPPRYEIECHKSGELVAVPQLILGITPSDKDASKMSLEKLAKRVMMLDEKMSEQAEYSQRTLLKLQRLVQTQQEARCPSIFTIVPAGPKRTLGSPFELHLYCEEPGEWHRLPEPAGCYPITQPVEWLRKLGPYLQFTLTAFKHAAPLVGPILGIAVDKLDEQIKAECGLMKELASQMPDELRHKQEIDGLDTLQSAPSAHAATEADFRGIQAMLRKLDPEDVWGGLSRTTTPEGLTLYLCSHHLARYRQSVRV